MSRNSFQYLFTLCTVLITSVTNAQFLSYHDTVATYSMFNTAADLLGNHLDIELINTPYSDTNGVYCNGLYIFDVQPGGSTIITENLEELYDPAFAVGIEFSLDTQVSKTAPVIVLGEGWRYVGVLIQPDGSVDCLFNGAEYKAQDITIEAGEWHRATVMYTVVDSTAQYWIDGQLLMTRSGQLNRPPNDGRVSNTHYGTGLTFKGYLRNLTIWSSEEFLSNAADVRAEEAINLYPNPATSSINVDLPQGSKWFILNISGMQMTGGTWNDSPIDVTDLPAGLYYFTYSSPMSRNHFVKSFVKQSSN